MERAFEAADLARELGHHHDDTFFFRAVTSHSASFFAKVFIVEDLPGLIDQDECRALFLDQHLDRRKRKR